MWDIRPNDMDANQTYRFAYTLSWQMVGFSPGGGLYNGVTRPNGAIRLGLSAVSFIWR